MSFCLEHGVNSTELIKLSIFYTTLKKGNAVLQWQLSWIRDMHFSCKNILLQLFNNIIYITTLGEEYWLLAIEKSKKSPIQNRVSNMHSIFSSVSLLYELYWEGMTRFQNHWSKSRPLYLHLFNMHAKIWVLAKEKPVQAIQWI